MSLTPTAQRWAHLVTALEQSDLTARAFAAKHNVNPSTLSWWRSRFRGSMPRGFLEVELSAAVPATPAPLIRVELPGDAVVVVPVGVDLRWLRAVVEALS
jgi:transposase-like protein